MFEWLNEVKLRLRALLLRRRLEKDLEDELAFHVSRREEQLREAGTIDASRAARWRFGNITRFREECRELWTFAAIERVWADVKYARTAFARNPGFTAMVVLTLAFGIGANTAVFSVVRAVLLRPLPYNEPGQLAFVWKPLAPGISHGILTGDDVIALKERTTTLESFAVLQSWQNKESQMDLLSPDGSDRLRGAQVTPNFFELLGTKALVGRIFASSDAEAGPAERVHLLRLIIGSGLAPVILGATAGVGIAFGISRMLQSFMFQIAPTDPVTYASAALVMVVAAVAACLLPALRTMRIQPMTVLKQE